MTRTHLLLLVLLAALGAGCSAGEPAAAPTPAGTADAREAPPAERRPPETAAQEPVAAPPPPPEAPPAAERPAAPPAPAGDPEELARQIVEAERTIRSDTADEAEIAAAGHLQQAVYRHLARQPEWRAPVLTRVPEDLHGSVVAHVDAATDLGALTTPQQRLPAWRILAPPPADDLLAFYREAQEVFGVGWEYLAAIHLVETRMGRIHGTSPAGAQGPMQFMPGTWAAYGEGDVNDPRDAILAAARYLSANGAPATMESALFAYNRSDAYVRAISAYAEQMRADPRTFRGYYHWQVYYRTVEGDQLLPVGYDGTAGPP